MILSNVGVLSAVLCLILACNQWGCGTVFKIYGIPWLIVNHWFVTMTYLHHTDPTIPRYRGQAWTYARGAAATIDRDFLGWQGIFFLHGVSHYHVVHHFFPKIPHCKFSSQASRSHLTGNDVLFCRQRRRSDEAFETVLGRTLSLL